MGSDPFDPWYERQLGKHAVKHVPANWAYFTISYDANSNGKVEEKSISLSKIDEWIAARVKTLSRSLIAPAEGYYSRYLGHLALIFCKVY